MLAGWKHDRPCVPIEFVGWHEVVYNPRRHKDGHNQEELLPAGDGEEEVAAEEDITSNRIFADKPLLTRPHFS
jgi:hypothetical protein